MPQSGRRWCKELRDIRRDGVRVELFDELNDVQETCGRLGLFTRVALFIVEMILVRTNLVPRMRSIISSLKGYTLDTEEQLAVARAKIAQLEHNAKQTREARTRRIEQNRTSYPPLSLPCKPDNDVVFHMDDDVEESVA